MDITALSTDLSQYRLESSISCELLANAKELAEVQAQALTEMIDSIPVPGVGEHIDISL